MSLSLHVRGGFLAFFCGLMVAAPVTVWGQSGFITEAGEYAPAGSLIGDQAYPQVSIKPGGGFLVWQDNNTDGEGLGISARRVDGNLSGTLSAFRVNAIGAYDQELPRVSLLNNGGAVFVWQGGKLGFQRIYARFLSASNIWVTSDVAVSAITNSQRDAVVATLTDGNVVVAWANFTNSTRDVYVQRLSPTGQRLGAEILANQFNAYNQRDPAIAALSDGRFVIVWISEQQRSAFASGLDNTNGVPPAAVGTATADVYARIFNADGVPAGGEFLVNTAVLPCANPTVAAAADGGFMATWMQKDLAVADNSWDVFARPFSGGAVGGTVRRVNATTHGDQLAPKISAIGADYLVVWTSMGQDGSQEGVYGQFLLGDGTFNGSEFRVNSTTVAFQKFPAVAGDGASRFLTVWSSFVGGIESVDLYAQRYVSASQPLTAPDAPFVTVLSSNALSVTWPALQGYSVANYQVFSDGAGVATATATSNWWTMTGLAANSTHYFQLKYVLTDGRQSPLSVPATNTTYGGGATWGGIPQEWMMGYFGGDIFSWPSPYADSDGDGVSNLNEWLAGTNPKDANSVLRVRLQPTVQGLYLNWNTEAGLLYQVQSATSLGVWTNVGGPRFAAGLVDSMYVGSGSTGFYRIVRLR